MHKQEGSMHKGNSLVHMQNSPWGRSTFPTSPQGRNRLLSPFSEHVSHVSSSYSCRSTSTMCLSHPVPGGSCLLQSLSRGPRAARVVGIGWTCGWSLHHSPLYIFIYLLVRPLPIPWLLYFQRMWFLHTPMVSTGGANPAMCSNPLHQQPGLMWSSYLTAQGKAVVSLALFLGPFVLGLTWLYRKSWHATSAQGLPKSHEALKGG